MHVAERFVSLHHASALMHRSTGCVWFFFAFSCVTVPSFQVGIGLDGVNAGDDAKQRNYR